MAGRIRRFIKRNMSYPKGFKRKGASTYTSWINIGEGETNVNPFNLAVSGLGLVSRSLLFGPSDFANPVGTSQSNKQKARLARGFTMTGQISPDESATDPYTLRVMAWLMLSPTDVSLNWLSSNLTPFNATISDNLSAQPAQILAVTKPFLVVNGAIAPGVPQSSAGGRFTLRCRYPINWRYPQRLDCFYFIETLNDGTTGGVVNSDVSLSYRFKGKLQRSNLA